MKKILLSLSLIAGAMVANAAFLKTPVITSETVEDGKVTITWSYDNSVDDATRFQVTVYKMHKATEAHEFVLAESDFEYIKSETGTMKDHEYRGTQWDQVLANPGWWVKSPTYMTGAMGTDTWQNFVGSDMDDVFNGSYMLSPDYDMTNVTDKTFYVTAHLGNEAQSVTGGWAVWTWNSNWWDPSNINYRPVYSLDHQFETLNNSAFKEFTEVLTFPNADDYEDPDILDEINGMDLSRSRVHFYGRGYSTYWVDDFKVSVKLAAGDMVDYGAEEYTVDGNENSFVIDTTGDTENDYIYAYDVRAVLDIYDEDREIMTIRAINYPYNTPKNVIGEKGGVDNVVANGSDVNITAFDGNITVIGAATAEVYNMTGVCVYNGAADAPIAVGHGVYVVKAGDKAVKVVL